MLKATENTATNLFVIHLDFGEMMLLHVAVSMHFSAAVGTEYVSALLARLDRKIFVALDANRRTNFEAEKLVLRRFSRSVSFVKTRLAKMCRFWLAVAIFDFCVTLVTVAADKGSGFDRPHHFVCVVDLRNLRVLFHIALHAKARDALVALADHNAHVAVATD